MGLCQHSWEIGSNDYNPHFTNREGGPIDDQELTHGHIECQDKT